LHWKAILEMPAGVRFHLPAEVCLIPSGEDAIHGFQGLDQAVQIADDDQPFDCFGNSQMFCFDHVMPSHQKKGSTCHGDDPGTPRLFNPESC
jgi:hypothetical protein